MASDIGVDQASRFVEGGDVRLGTAFHLPNTPIWTQDPTKDLDKDGLNDEWESQAVQSLRPTFLFPAGEGLFENPDHRVALFTRITPTEVDGTTYIIFLNSAAYTKDYGAPDLGNLTGGHNGDVSNFQTVWRFAKDSSTILLLDSVWTSGHVGLKREHEHYKLPMNGNFSFGDAEVLGASLIEFTEDGFLKIYMEEDKHSNWSSRELHDRKGGSYPIGSDIEIRPDAYNVGEPWFHPDPFANDVNSLFAGERVWNDPDGLFCGGLECDKATRGKVLGGLFGAGGGAFLGFVLGGILGLGGAIAGGIGGGIGGGIYGSQIGGKIDGASGGDIGSNLTDALINKLFKNQNVTRKGIDFYASGVPVPDFSLVINRLQTLDDDGLDGGTIDDRANFYAKVTVNGKQYTTSQVKEKDEDKGIGVFPDWGFYHSGKEPKVIPITIEIHDADGFGSGGEDEKGDINPIQGEKYLYFLYDRVTGQLTLTDKDFNSIEGQLPLISANGQFYFEGNRKPDGAPGDDQVGIWFTLPVPEIASPTSDSTLKLNIGPNNVLGSNPDEIVSIRHISGGSGNEVIEINSKGLTQSYGNGTPAGTFTDVTGFAGDGNDTIVLHGVLTSAYLGGGNGDDRLEIINSPVSITQRSVLDGGAGNDTLRGGAGNDGIYGGSNDDQLFGDAGDDHITGNDGNDFLDAGSGNDIVSGGTGFDTIYAGAGEDIIGGVGNADYIDGGDGDDVILGDSSFDTINEITFATPNNEARDTILGGSGDDVILGEWGDDLIYGNDGIDKLFGGVGNDTIDGGDDNDTLEGNSGDDILYGGSGDDLIRGDTEPRSKSAPTAENASDVALIEGAGNDQLIGGAGNDQLDGGKGDDFLVGGAGIDQLDGGEGNDTADLSDIETGINANLSAGTFSYPNALGIAVTEVIRNIENIIGTQFGDTLTGNQAANRLEGGNGDDRLFGGNGNDTLLGGVGDDWLAGGAGINLLDGGDGFDLALLGDLPSSVRADLNTDRMTYQDTAGNIVTEIIRNIEGITSGAFNDELIGDAGNNRFDGRGGNDTLRGSAGNDYFLGGYGIDFIDGGDGFDTVNLVEDFDFGIVANLSTGTVTYTNATGSTIAETILNIESVIATQFNDEVIGNDADNLLYGLGGNDRLFGGDSNDGLVGGDGIDFIDGGAGFDTADLAHINRALVANLNSGTVTYTDAAGTSVTEIILNIEAIIATQFNDTLIGSDSNNRLFGGAGGDRLFGGAGNDELIGGDGDDILASGSGSLNRLSGNAGSDIFVLASDGFSQVLDFELGKDRIGLSENLTVSQLKIEQGTGVNSSSTWIKLTSDNSNLMLLSNVQASALTTAMFLPASSYQSSLLG